MDDLRGLMRVVCIGRGIAEIGLYRFAGSPQSRGAPRSDRHLLSAHVREGCFYAENRTSYDNT